MNLEQQTIPACAVIPRQCGTCHWFRWSLGPTGRKRKTERGKCDDRMDIVDMDEDGRTVLDKLRRV